ncbi:HK97 family phage prohead protease [Ancylobacter polymorphus]|uniref:HK97 family phage prohead protease n=1 Tax=Ancylobacter polymorphus TaxID=223390 RepID=A0A9E7A6I5_9HYPH|nr:HK97 family phage prohead protease [Ancylobacter polymorphus]UOK71704.1 HK97 family phage prohead protease [Ancylobacter polymorphus]
MTINRLEVKFAASDVDGTTGEFKGYGAVFGNVDSHGDIIAPGAFAASLAEWSKKGRLPAMKLMHGSGGNPFTGDDLPIGKWTKMAEDDRGLYVEGKLSGLDTDRGKTIHALMKDGVLDGLSIGYRATKAKSGAGEAKRVLEAVKLFEISLVDDPSNDRSRVTGFKSFNPRDIEDALRDAGLSRTDSVKAVAVFKSALRDEAETDTTPRDEDETAGEGAAEVKQQDECLVLLAERIKALTAA